MRLVFILLVRPNKVLTITSEVEQVMLLDFGKRDRSLRLFVASVLARVAGFAGFIRFVRFTSLFFKLVLA